MSYAADCRMLGLDPDVDAHDPEFIKEKFRELALKLHPDVDGGDRDRFEAARAAYGRLYGEAQVAWSKCPDCEGCGEVVQRAGWNTLLQSCARCCGTGLR